VSGLSIAKSLELHLLRPALTRADVIDGAERAGEHNLAAVCVYPVHVAAASRALRGVTTRVVAAIGFPYGQETLPARMAAVEQARLDGAHEVAVMLDHSLLVGGEIDASRRELDSVLGRSYWNSLVNTKGQAQLTIVAETTMLDLALIEPLLADLHETAAGFLQTSTGHQPRAVTEDHVRTLRELLPADVAIKAVGGVAALEDAAGLINAGAVRVGSGSAVSIANEQRHARTPHVGGGE
jgi:deoxyribose-phosphate aldolase